MIARGHDLGALGTYVLGGLDENHKRSIEEHLTRCELCRKERVDLEKMAKALGELPPEAFLDGRPEDADLLLQRTLHQVRRESARRDLRRRAKISAVAGLMVLAALAGGVLLGRSQNRPLVVTAPPQAAPSAPQPPGTLVGSHTDPTTGARLTVRVTPAVGWVRVNAAVTGIPEGQRCRLWVVARDGRRELAGSWLVSARGAREGTALDGTALIAPVDVTAVEVSNTAGHNFVSVPM